MLVVKLTKTDDVLLTLSRTIPKCIERVGSFQYKGKTYHFNDNFASAQHMKCDVCGNYPLIDVSVIRNEKGDGLNLCNDCIDQITSKTVSSWFKEYRKNRQNILDNRKYIDGLSSILAAYERDKLPFKIQSEEVKLLRNMFVQMSSGLDLRTKDTQLAEFYINQNLESETAD
jgi:hypothetical protein